MAFVSSARNIRPDALTVNSASAKLIDRVCQVTSDGYIVGATHEELCKVVGWGQCLPALRAACERVHVKLITKKVGKEPTRYYGKPYARSKVVPIVLAETLEQVAA